MKKVCKFDNLVLYEYTPTVLRPFFINMEPLSLKRRVRMLQAYFSGYKVYYLRQNDDYIAYCLVQSGRDNRYKFADENDIMVGPYFVSEKYRGQKLSITILNLILKHTDFKFQNAYDYIHEDNVPSIKASEAVGFQLLSRATLSKYTRAIKLTQNGDYLIFKYESNKK